MLRASSRNYRSNGEGRRGAAAVEFAVVAPLLVLVLFGILEVSRLIELQQTTVNAAREAVRHSSAGSDADDVRKIVKVYLLNQNIPQSVVDGTTIAIHPDKYVNGKKAFVVNLEMPATKLMLGGLRLVSRNTTTLRAEAVGVRQTGL